MAFKPLDWYCRPVANGVWARTVDSAFGAYTPCAIDSIVISISYLVLLSLCCYRIWLIKKSFKVQRFRLRSAFYNYILGLLASYCAAEPLLRLVMDISIVYFDQQTGFMPFEIGSDLSQFAGPLLLNHLLKSMQQGDPAWIGYFYAFAIFLGVSFGVLCEAQYFQNAMRVGFRLRSTLV
ncbi:hypothetical protein CRG98_011707 [Punica granatum]|uniref:ABC transmembrane type-1 domain-containing protein n=1 Tax=Punica granatum TaxID=22663 RepID=A0A2I0KI18_PUNGR|nr:hypothetical protein CRG98_011707 [Punica granatum]